jgi:hypothetical protein
MPTHPSARRRNSYSPSTRYSLAGLSMSTTTRPEFSIANTTVEGSSKSAEAGKGPSPSSQLTMSALDETVDPGELLYKQQRNTRMIANTLILGSLGTVALYELLHVNAEALLALWEYGLGTTSDVTKTAVAVDLLVRLPVDAVRSYEALVPQNPILYKACTSGVAYGLGDLLSQLIQGRTLSTIDLPRSARSGAAGFIGHGPLCHYWLTFMETYLDFGGAWWATGIKVRRGLRVFFECH